MQMQASKALTLIWMDASVYVRLSNFQTSLLFPGCVKMLPQV